MKKIYTAISCVAIGVAAFAQTGRMAQPRLNQNYLPATAPTVGTQAIGDTLFWMPLTGVYVNPTDQPNWNYQTEDLDGLSTTGSNNFPAADWGLFYSMQPSDYFPWDGTPGVDTAFYWAATSWFAPPGQADNWLEMGPITIPANGANLRWYIKTNPSYRDGYRVLLNTTSLNFSDFTDPAIYTRADLYPSNNTATDTIFQLVTVDIPASYNNMPVYLAFHHNANDMDVIYLDEIMITEGTTGITEVSNGLSVMQNMPNPFKGTTEIDYSLTNAVDAVELTIYDVAGKKVKEVKQEQVGAGKHFFKVNSVDMSAGMYYYTLKAGATSVTKKMVVID